MERQPSDIFERDGDIVPGADVENFEQGGKVRLGRLGEDDLDYAARFTHEVAHAAERLVEADTSQTQEQHEQQRAHAREFINPMIDRQFEAMMGRAQEIVSPRVRDAEIARIKALRVAYESKRARRA